MPADETCCSTRQRDLDRFSAMNETDITRLCRDPAKRGPPKAGRSVNELAKLATAVLRTARDPLRESLAVRLSSPLGRSCPWQARPEGRASR